MPSHEFGTHVAGDDGCRHGGVEKTHLNVELGSDEVVQFDVTEGVARFRMYVHGDEAEIFEPNCFDEVWEAREYVSEHVDEVTLAEP